MRIVSEVRQEGLVPSQHRSRSKVGCCMLRQQCDQSDTSRINVRSRANFESFHHRREASDDAAGPHCGRSHHPDAAQDLIRKVRQLALRKSLQLYRCAGLCLMQ